MRTPRLLRQLRLAMVLVAAGVFAGGIGLAHAQGHGGGGAHYGGGGHVGGGLGGGRLGGGYGAHYGYRGGFGGWRGGYYGGWGRGYWGGGWGCCGWGWWGPGWWGVGVYAAWLPWYYNLYWWDGYPYYYYNNSYYVWDGDAGEYQQVNPPQGFRPDTSAASAGQAPMNSELFAYPRAGQSPEQQARDKDECSRWASGQTGAQAPPGAPGAPGGTAGASPGSTAAGAPPSAVTQHDAYLRAEAACLEGRNYTVR